MQAYRDLIAGTEVPSTTVEPYTYNADDLSCYGYVTADSVNFRTAADTNSKRIRQLKKYALCLVYGTENRNGEIWYRVGYGSEIGYVKGEFFRQMTVGEAEEFLDSSRYREGIANNAAAETSSGSSGSSGPVTTGTPSGVVNAEDQKVSEWVNPATGSQVSYEPFDPFATPSPLEENTIPNAEYLDGLAAQVQAGTMKREDLETELEKFYKDAKDPKASVETAMGYLNDKLGLATEEPSESPEPMATEEITEFPQEQGSGGAGWWIALGVVAVAGAGGYAWYAQKQKKRQAAQRLAQKKAAEQRAKGQGQARPGQGAPKGAGAQKTGSAQNGAPQAGSAQNAAKVRSGKPGNGAKKRYSGGIDNPYGRYSASGNEEDASYTASFKPGARETKPVKPEKPETAQKPEEAADTDQES